MFKCLHNYCVDSHMVCDQIKDCPDGEDEWFCNEFVCAGLLKCRSDNICVHPVDICDGIVHCLSSGDDESLCDVLPCPDECECRGSAVHCQGLTDIFLISKQSTAVVLSDVDIILSYAFQHFSHIVHLKMTNCSFIENTLYEDTLSGLKNMLKLVLLENNIERISANAFSSMVILRYINLQHNQIKVINSLTFYNLEAISHLNLSSFHLTKLHLLCFSGLVNLHHLNLSFNLLHTLKQSVFTGLENINNIDLRFNPIQYIDHDTFLNIESNIMIYFQSFSYCCYLRNNQNCSVNSYNLQKKTRCNKIFKYNLHKSVNIAFSVLSIAVNLLLQWHIRVMKKKSSSYILLLRHSIAVNLVPHLYMLILIMISLHNNDNYIYLSSTWIQSYECYLLNILITVGFVMPKVLVFLMSLSQLIAVKFVFKLQSNSMHLVGGLLCSWTVVVLLAVIKQIVFPVSNIVCFSFFLDAGHSFIDNIFISLLFIGMLLLIIGIAFMNHMVLLHVRKSNVFVKSSKAASNAHLLMKNSIILVTIEMLTWLLLLSIVLYSYYVPLYNHKAMLYISVVIHTYVFMYTTHLSMKIL